MFCQLHPAPTMQHIVIRNHQSWRRVTRSQILWDDRVQLPNQKPCGRPDKSIFLWTMVHSPIKTWLKIPVGFDLSQCYIQPWCISQPFLGLWGYLVPSDKNVSGVHNVKFLPRCALTYAGIWNPRPFRGTVACTIADTRSIRLQYSYYWLIIIIQPVTKLWTTTRYKHLLTNHLRNFCSVHLATWSQDRTMESARTRVARRGIFSACTSCHVVEVVAR